MGLGQQRCQALGPGSSRCRAQVFLIPLTFVRISIPMVPMTQWVGQHGSKAVESQLLPIFSNIVNDEKS